MWGSCLGLHKIPSPQDTMRNYVGNLQVLFRLYLQTFPGSGTFRRMYENTTAREMQAWFLNQPVAM